MELVRNLPQQYRQDPWVLALADAILGVLEGQNAASREIRAQLSLETITWALEIEERLAGIVPPAGATLESRRSVLAARYRSSGKVSIETIQAVADAWRNGEVAVSFTGAGSWLPLWAAWACRRIWMDSARRCPASSRRICPLTMCCGIS